MKKLIIVIMALITLFSASVTVYGSSVEWQVLGEIYNAEFNSRACTLCEAPSSRPYLSPNMVDSNSTLATQATTYNLLYSLYEHLTLNGVSFTSNVVTPSVVQWYEYGGYCWILVHVDEDATINAGKTGVVSNYAAKMLYCDAPDTGYTISPIAGVGSYYLTDRPIGTAGNGYGGDLYVPYDNWMNIKSLLTDVGGQYSYYPFIYSVDGEMRYYIASLIGGQKYFICNRAGQLYYTVKEEAGTGGDGDGSTFDDTEVITAINSVYDALDIGFYDVCNWLEAIQKNISSLNNDVLLMSQNVVNGFADLAVVGGRIEGTLSTIVLDFDGFRSDFAYYFKGLTKPYGEEITVELKGEDNLLEWSNGDYVKDIQVEDDQSSRLYISYLGSENEFGGTPDVSIANFFDGYYLDAESNGDGFYNYIQCVAPDNADKVVYTNFVKNGDLRSPLNSNGKLVYSTKGKTIDGWTMWGDNGAITIEDGYVNYSVDSYDGYRNFYYPLDMDYELNATYTVSLLARVNSCTGTVRCRAANGAYGLTGFDGHSILLAPYSGGGLVLLTSTFTNTTQLYDNARLEFNVNPNASIDIDIYAVKVERSSSQSLAFLGYDGSYYLFTDVYTPPNPKIMIDNELFELSTTLSFCGNEHDKIYYNAYEGKWMVYRYLGDSSSYLPLYDQKIMNRTVGNDSVGGASILVRDLTSTGLAKYLYDGKNHIDIDSPTVVTVTYYHERTWFDVMYVSLDKLYARLDSMDSREYIDEVESKLTSLESTMTSQHETIVGYWDVLQQGITSWGDMELYALYGFSPLGNEYPDSYLKKIYDVLYLWFGSDEESAMSSVFLNFALELFQGQEDIAMHLNYLRNDVEKISDGFATWFGTGDTYSEGVYFQALYSIMNSLGYYDVYDQYHSYSKLIYDSVDGLETTLSNIYDRLGDIEDAVVSADNVIIDITTDNDAFNIFYITKTDGTTESVGDAAKDAAKVVGEFLSVFYRLIFADGLENADIIHDFEEVYTVTDSGVSVW